MVNPYISGRRKCIITALYRSPSLESNSNTPEEMNIFICKLEETIENVKKKNPFISLFIGAFNAKNTKWWGSRNSEMGILLEQLINFHNLVQIINEPTHIRPNCIPSCIDVMIASVPNLIIESGAYPSLLGNSHHQIIFAKLDFNIKHAPPYKRKIWNYELADVVNIKTCSSLVDWHRHFYGITPHEKVRFLTNCTLNAFENFCPSKEIVVKGKDAAWMTKEIKSVLNEKTKLFKKYVKNGFNENDRYDRKSRYLQYILFTSMLSISK